MLDVPNLVAERRSAATCETPDGYLTEVGQSTGLLQGELAAERPEDLPG
jgi:hypothetical protein